MLEELITDEQRALMSQEGSLEDRWPIVVFIGRGRPSVAATRAFHEVLDAIFALEQPFALISDMREMEIPDHEVRKLLGQYQGERKAQFSGFLVADAHVIGNKLIRGLVTVINWIAPPNHPQGFFKTMEEAERWCQRKLRDAGVAETS